MKITAKIVLFAMLLAFSMQSTAMATEYKLKSASEIGKNLFGMGVEKAKENPEMVAAAAKKMMGENEIEPPESEEDKVDKDKDDKKNDE